MFQMVFQIPVSGHVSDTLFTPLGGHDVSDDVSDPSSTLCFRRCVRRCFRVEHMRTQQNEDRRKARRMSNIMKLRRKNKSMVGVEAAAPVAGVGVAMANQAKHSADTVGPAAVVPTIHSAQYPDSLIDVWGESFQTSVAIETRCLVCCGTVSSPISDPGC